MLEPSGSGILPDPTALVRPRLSLDQDHVDIDENRHLHPFYQVMALFVLEPLQVFVYPYEIRCITRH
jgi:hypothetical protein